MVLSSGTLSLRFMQNARRAPHTEPVHPHVKDDAQWELSPGTRQPWGPTAYPGEKAVTYETSYLPFLFPSLHDTPAADGPSSLSPSNTLRPRGRRVFKRGQEITQQPSPPPTDSVPQQNMVQQAAEPSKTSRPHSISSTRVPSLAARHSKKSNRDPSKAARNLIFDLTRVGTDLQRTSSTQATTFLRPAGVDGPIDPPRTSNPSKTASHSSTGAPNASEPKVKRSCTSDEAREPKKKSRLTLIE